MKKKIKLFAYKCKDTALIAHYSTEIQNLSSYTRAPEWDMEKEVDLLDEVKKPREIQITNSLELGFIITGLTSKDFFNTKFIEKLPGHVMVSRNIIANAWRTVWSRRGVDDCDTTHTGTFDDFIKELGLEK